MSTRKNKHDVEGFALDIVAVKVRLEDHTDHVTAEPGGRFFVLSHDTSLKSLHQLAQLLILLYFLSVLVHNGFNIKNMLI